jgi:predicted thioesterase
MIESGIVPGLRAEQTITVADSDTAIAYGSGSVPVLATPRVIALCEAVAVAAVADHLTDGMTTVGTRIELDHLVASPIGTTVAASATVVAVDGRRSTFDVRATMGEVIVARGVHTRVTVQEEGFGQ